MGITEWVRAEHFETAVPPLLKGPSTGPRPLARMSLFAAAAVLRQSSTPSKSATSMASKSWWLSRGTVQSRLCAWAMNPGSRAT